MIHFSYLGELIGKHPNDVDDEKDRYAENDFPGSCGQDHFVCFCALSVSLWFVLLCYVTSCRCCIRYFLITGCPDVLLVHPLGLEST